MGVPVNIDKAAPKKVQKSEEELLDEEIEELLAKEKELRAEHAEAVRRGYG